MKFGPQPLANCAGSILAHGLLLRSQRLQKGHILSADDIESLEAEGISELVVAILEPGDVPEDAAAERIAAAAQGPHISAKKAHKGRVNLESGAHGVLMIDVKQLHEINSLDEGLTVASLETLAPIRAKDMVASIKIIPFAIGQDVVARAETILAARPLLSLAPFRHLRCALIQTILPHQSAKARDKTRRLIDWRLVGLGNQIDSAVEVRHETTALSKAISKMIGGGAELLLVHGASATVDRRDVVPAAIVEAGGTIERFGMPVDPGNLLVLGRVGEVPAVGLPGCAGSPKLNGLDWVLERLVAGQVISSEDFAAMGKGGLLKETPDRPQPRRRSPTPSEASSEVLRGAVLLAAGSSERMGEENKLLCRIDGVPLVQKALQSLKGADIRQIAVVLGHQANEVREVLDEAGLVFIENPDFAVGLAGSLRCGLKALSDVDAVAVMLGDMPDVQPATIDRLFETIRAADGILAAVPTWQGKRGNPVVWHRALFDPMIELEGDQGARSLLDKYSAFVAEVPVDDPGVCLDVDTEEALKALGGMRHRSDDPA
jgi:molybdenum cofactor cytidylyltransferase